MFSSTLRFNQVFQSQRKGEKPNCQVTPSDVLPTCFEGASMARLVQWAPPGGAQTHESPAVATDTKGARMVSHEHQSVGPLQAASDCCSSLTASLVLQSLRLLRHRSSGAPRPWGPFILDCFCLQVATWSGFSGLPVRATVGPPWWEASPGNELQLRNRKGPENKQFLPGFGEKNNCCLNSEKHNTIIQRLNFDLLEWTAFDHHLSQYKDEVPPASESLTHLELHEHF